MTSLVVSGGRIVTADGVIDGFVEVVDGTITAVTPGPAGDGDGDVVVNAAGGWIAPGFVDAQINGSDGIDLTSEPHRLGELAALLPRDGVTSFVPTIVTCPVDGLAAALATSPTVAPGAASPVGFHLEGPMLAPARRGAHRAGHLRLPGAISIDEWARSGGVAMVTIAPELPGALEVIRTLVARGVVMALGHTDATADEFRAGIEAGATVVTHLFNAMRPFGHRDPGPIGATLASATLVAGIIADGIHVDPLAVAMAWRSLGPGRTMLVSDAVAARHAADGGGNLGATRVTRDETGVRLADGTLAGSDLRLDQAVRNLVAFTGCAIPDALRAASTTPAAVLGLSDRGAVEPGRRADLVVLDDALAVVATIVGGVVAWRS